MEPMKMNFRRRGGKAKKTENVGYIEVKDAVQGSGIEMYIYGDIVSSEWDKWSDEDRCPKDIADFLARIDRDAEMTIYINSGGGDVFAGIGIYNILKRHTGHKKGIVDGIAASIASVIMMACDEVVVASGAQVMVHKPLTAAWGNADDFAKVIEQLDKCQQSITNIYMEKAREGVTEEEIAEKINRETWMSGAEAAELFDISVDEKPAAVACIGCMMERYLRKPEGICTESAEEAEARREAAEEEAAIIAEMELCGI
nr:head maturation protease, ClpP-related [uncultured Acetatifactor sp.]